MFNTYGKQEESLTNSLQAFDLTLEGYPNDIIAASFKEWLDEQSAMPTPADIRKICHRRSQRGSYEAPVMPAPRRQADLHPWAYKPYADAKTDGTLTALIAHYIPRSEAYREAGYEWLRYACDFLGYPRTVLAAYREKVALPAERAVQPSLHAQ